MQIGIRLHDGEKKPVEELLPIIKEQGFSCAHIALSKSMKEYNTGITALTPGFAMYLKRLFAENDLDIAVLGCYLNLAVPDKNMLEKNLEVYKAHIRFASALGCGVVGTETGAPNIEYKYEHACHTEEALSVFIKNLRIVTEYAEKMGVLIAIEPVWKHIVYSPKTARRVLDEINSPNLRIIFDPVNLLCYDNYMYRYEIFDEAIELLGSDIAVVHIKDFTVQGKELIATAAGLGEMDYRAIMRFIKNDKPFIHATLENTTPENAANSRKYIADIWRKE